MFSQSGTLPGMNAIRTARQRAREELTREIREEARKQLVTEGAQRLSLRSIARELGMVSSALYRYFPSRDELLTALIIDAYNALGDAVEYAEQRVERGRHRERWRVICETVMRWAKEHPQEYALIYGSPVVGYQAPQDTIAPAGRTLLVLGRLLSDAAGVLTPADTPLPRGFADQADHVAEVIGAETSPAVLAQALIAWTQLFGMVSFELFGHFVGVLEPADEFFDHAVARTADFIGFPS